MLRARRRPARPEARLRGDGRQPDRADRAATRDIFQVGARNMQNFTLLRELGPHAQAGAAEARHLRDDRGVAAVGRVHPGRRQQRRHPLRARHPHVRELHAQHARHLGDSGRQEAEPPADRRRPEPRRPAGATRWRRWRARRWPPAPTGCIIEVHSDPDHALSDGAQSMFPAQFDRLMAELRIIAPAIGRSICLEPVTRRGWS